MKNFNTEEITDQEKKTIGLSASRELEALEKDIQRGAMTISQLLAEKGVKGGISLSKGPESTISSLLSTNKGLKYKIGETLAQGGMGQILDAKDLNCRRKVAMKVLSEQHRNSTDQMLRFIVEAQICAQLEHPSIVPVYELSVDASGSVFYTMKLVRGVTLVDILIEIKKNNKEYIDDHPLIRLLNFFLRVCDAVAFAHSRNVVHRDLKPENIMIGDYGEVLVMDWGLAKILDPEGVKKEEDSSEPDDDQDYSSEFDDSIDSILTDGKFSDSMKTMYGQVMGTPGFMPPEQALGKVEDIDIRSDVYALGGILYNLLVLQPPITGLSIKQLIRKIVKGDIRSPSLFNGEQKFPHCPGEKIPEPLSAIAMKALSSHPADRYQDVRELQNDVEKYLGGFATSVEDAGFVKLLFLLIKRNKAQVISAAAALFVIVSLVTIFMIKIIEAKEVAEKNLSKFMAEHSARKEISHKLLTTAIEGIKENNPKQKDLFHRYSLLDEDFSLNMQGNSDLVDIAPIGQLPLTHLNLSHTKIDDIKVLVGMPLKWVDISRSNVKDLTPFAGLPLDYLDISNTLVKNLKPLSGVGLTTLNIAGTKLNDIRELALLSIKNLIIDPSQLIDSELLKNLKLEHLSVKNCENRTLKLIKDLGVKSLELHGHNLKSVRLLRNMDLTSLSLVETRVRKIDVLTNLGLATLKISGSFLSDIEVVGELPLKELCLERCYNLQDISPLSNCTQLEKLLIPPHITDLKFLKKLKYLTVVADNREDYEAGQSLEEFMEYHNKNTKTE